LLSLILAQGAHSVEEYVTRLYEVFAPARFVSSLVGHDLAVGFLFVNAALVTFGLWCWAFPVRSGRHAPRGLVWFWTILKLGNGVGHLALAVSREGYFPGGLAVLQIRHAGWPSVFPPKGSLYGGVKSTMAAVVAAGRRVRRRLRSRVPGAGIILRRFRTRELNHVGAIGLEGKIHCIGGFVEQNRTGDPVSIAVLDGKIHAVGS
jgi:hypothetical protein